MVKKTDSLDCTLRCPKLNAALHLLHPMSRNPEREDTTQETCHIRALHATDCQKKVKSSWERSGEPAELRAQEQVAQRSPPARHHAPHASRLISRGPRLSPRPSEASHTTLKVSRWGVFFPASRSAQCLPCAPVASLAAPPQENPQQAPLPVSLPNPRPVYHPTRPLHPAARATPKQQQKNN